VTAAFHDQSTSWTMTEMRHRLRDRGSGTRWVTAALTVVSLGLLATGCSVVQVNEEGGQSARVYTVEQVANALTDPVIGTVILRKEGLVSQCGDDWGCPKDHYPSDYELGRGGSRSIIVYVLAQSAKSTYQMDVKDIRGNSDSVPLGSFAAWRANVDVTGPKRLRGRVLRLLRAMPPPSQTLGQITPPRREINVSGPAITHLDLDAPDAPHERIYLPDQVTKVLRQVVPNAPAVRTEKAPCRDERPCTYVEYDDIGLAHGRQYLVNVSGSSILARENYRTDAADVPDDRTGDIVRRVANVEFIGLPRLVRRLAALLRKSPPSVPLNRVIAPTRDGDPVRIRTGH
jgi:hypothetical protein